MAHNAHSNGFTLVELAIVLVIIGLLVGGVLVGQDLIRAAEINATNSQITKYDTAANTFRTAYRGYPGDIRNPGRFTLIATNSTGATGLGNGDNVIQSGACTDANGFGGESAMFWTHLSQANLIPDSTNIMTDFADVSAQALSDRHLPPARLGNGNRFHITNTSARNYYVLAGFTASAVTSCTLTAGDTLSPQTASQLDSKTDDGNATTGLMISVLNGAAPTAVGGGSAVPDNIGTDDCYDTDTGTYATTTEALSNAMQCQMRMRASF